MTASIIRNKWNVGPSPHRDRISHAMIDPTDRETMNQ